MKKFLVFTLMAIALIACEDSDSSGGKPEKDVATITLETSKIEFDAFTSTATVKFHSSHDWEVNIYGSLSASGGGSSDWITIEPESGSAGDAEITIKAQPNYHSKINNRMTTIRIYAGKTMKNIEVKQKHFINTIDEIMDPTYSSTDFSQDGETSVMQYADASVGEGINLVFMGEGFTDRLIADGTYDKIMHSAMESLFSMEPYKSFRHYFTCHQINVVSKDETIADGHDTALKVTLSPNSTHVYGDNQKVIDYLVEKLGLSEKMDDVVAFVVVNVTSRHGTCHLFGSETFRSDGSGFAVAYTSLSDFKNTVLHEGSHGFAKLADEYISSSYIEMQRPQGDIDHLKQVYEPHGWFKNIDVTDNPEEIKWSNFLSDSRYAEDDIGIFEGAWYYGLGAYRPSMNSMMNGSYNGYGFNAPSREAIYYRIHMLAFGPEWEYDYEKFVEYDMQNIGESKTMRSGGDFRYVEDIAHQSPITYKHSWRDEIEK